jgi:hypothetical protein
MCPNDREAFHWGAPRIMHRQCGMHPAAPCPTLHHDPYSNHLSLYPGSSAPGATPCTTCEDEGVGRMTRRGAPATPAGHMRHAVARLHERGVRQIGTTM